MPRGLKEVGKGEKGDGVRLVRHLNFEKQKRIFGVVVVAVGKRGIGLYLVG
jgi:hypothetical protein